MSLLSPFPVLTHVLSTPSLVALIPTLATLSLAGSAIGAQDNIVVASLHSKLLCGLFFLTFGTRLTIRQCVEYLVNAGVEFLICFCLPNTVRTYQKIAKTHQVFRGYSVIF